MWRHELLSTREVSIVSDTCVYYCFIGEANASNPQRKLQRRNNKCGNIGIITINVVRVLRPTDFAFFIIRVKKSTLDIIRKKHYVRLVLFISFTNL